TACLFRASHTILPAFFFQAEDGIRDFHVTGVQTCALPISSCRCRRLLGSSGNEVSWRSVRPRSGHCRVEAMYRFTASASSPRARSEERRVGKEYRCAWGERHLEAG